MSKQSLADFLAVKEASAKADCWVCGLPDDEYEQIVNGKAAGVTMADMGVWLGQFHPAVRPERITTRIRDHYRFGHERDT